VREKKEDHVYNKTYINCNIYCRFAGGSGCGNHARTDGQQVEVGWLSVYY